MAYDPAMLAEVIETREDNLTTEQHAFLEAVMASVNEGGGKFFFLDAPGTATYTCFTMFNTFFVTSLFF